jgi:O26-antigen biosynthesis N-acetyl-L-fucosamine transferase
MHYLVISDSFTPKINSGSIIVGDLVNEMLRLGNKVTVITFQEELTKLYNIEEVNNLRIIRIKVGDRSKSRFHRALIEMTYSSKIISIFKENNFIDLDRVICYSPSIFFGKAVKWIKNTHRVPAYLVIRDIFPKWALDARLLKKGLIYYYFKYVEKTLYDSVDFLGIESKSDLEYFHGIVSKHNKKIEVLNNWSASIDSTRIKASSSFINEHKINIVYGGNVSEAQDLLALVKILDRDLFMENMIHLTIMGEGQQLLSIDKYIKKNNLHHISLYPAQDRYTYLSFLSKSDIGLISLNKKLLSHNYPLKMLGYMQLGKPIIASVNDGNEILDFFKRNKVGLASVAGDNSALNDNIKEISLNHNMRSEYGTNAISTFENEFTVESIMKKIESSFMEINN